MNPTPSKIQADRWITEYADYLFHFAHQRVDDVDLANDLVQDTFLSALESRDSFEGRSSELTWILKWSLRKHPKEIIE